MAKAARPGQFVIVMSHEFRRTGPVDHRGLRPREKVPSPWLVQAVGKSTKEMQQICRVGILSMEWFGPSGVPPLAGKKKVVCVGGGLGVAPIFPQAHGFKENGAYVIGILGFRTKNSFSGGKFRACVMD